MALACTVAARNTRPDTESTISTPTNVAGSDDNDTPSQQVTDANNNDNNSGDSADSAMNTIEDSEKLGETKPATST